MVVNTVNEDDPESNKCILPIFAQDHIQKSNTWLLGAKLIEKYYMVFDATPMDDYNLEYLRVGFGLADKLKEDEIGKDEVEAEKEKEKEEEERTNSLIEKYLLYVYIGLGILMTIILVIITFSCIKAARIRKVNKMNTEDLQSEASRLMSNFKDNMIKKNEK